MVQGFMRQSKGTVRVTSEVDSGTTFKLYFPAGEKPKQATPQDTAKPRTTRYTALKILLAEDDWPVARVLQHSLEWGGHKVVVAPTGDAALAIYHGNTDFDVLLTDVVMPGTLLGPDLAREIRKSTPEFPCIFLSGYAAEATEHGNKLDKDDIRLMKPIAREILLQAIQDAWTSRKSKTNS